MATPPTSFTHLMLLLLCVLQIPLPTFVHIYLCLKGLFLLLLDYKETPKKQTYGYNTNLLFQIMMSYFYLLHASNPHLSKIKPITNNYNNNKRNIYNKSFWVTHIHSCIHTSIQNKQANIDWQWCHSVFISSRVFFNSSFNVFFSCFFSLS